MNAARGPNVPQGLSWDHGGARVMAVIATVVATMAFMMPAAQAAADDGPMTPVIVRAESGSVDMVGNIIEDLDGEVRYDLDIIDGFAARIPAAGVIALEQHPAVMSVVPDGSLQFSGRPDKADPSQPRNHVQSIRPGSFWEAGFTGSGVDVALIDTGVTPTAGLNVVNGPDLSFESQNKELQHRDTFGHGTHMAGLIAGVPNRDVDGSGVPFAGIAPGARIVNIKVGNANGAVDVSQVIAALNWVVLEGSSNGFNVKVVNLSFGTDGVQSYQLDPLAFAVEAAWHAGVTVVVAAGNDGNAAALRNPATDPFVIAVGATDTQGTRTFRDDVVGDFSNCAGARTVDLVAPGTSVVSLRAVGSTIDAAHPEAHVGDLYIKGTGTSQSAAMVSGAAALVLSQRPKATPDQVKALLVGSAQNLGRKAKCQGAGTVDLEAAFKTPTPVAVQAHVPSTGAGSLELSRGTMHVEMDGVVLTGEQDIFGNKWSGASWSGASWSGASWSGASWSGASWSGASWSGASWSGASWSGASWSGASWSGASWSSVYWG